MNQKFHKWNQKSHTTALMLIVLYQMKQKHLDATYLSTSSRKLAESSSLRLVTSMEYKRLTMVRKLVHTICKAFVSCSYSWVICFRSMHESHVHMVPLASIGSPVLGNTLNSPGIPRKGESKGMSCSEITFVLYLWWYHIQMDAKLKLKHETD